MIIFWLGIVALVMVLLFAITLDKAAEDYDYGPWSLVCMGSLIAFLVTGTIFVFLGLQH